MTRRGHELRIELDGAEQTLGSCSCGGWERAADLETLAVTGRSREEALRQAHEQHARGLDGSEGTARRA